MCTLGSPAIILNYLSAAYEFYGLADVTSTVRFWTSSRRYLIPSWTLISHLPSFDPFLVLQLAIELTTALLLLWAARTPHSHHLASADLSFPRTS